MVPLLEEVLSLLQNSPALRGNPAEQDFWLEQSESLNEDDLYKLKSVLTQEADSTAKISSASAERMAKIDVAHAEELQNFKRVVLPKFVKKWEVAQFKKDDPENILTQLTNG